MKAVDSSVVIAAFASWHESHVAARNALVSQPHVVAHAAIEAYSVLTRLPPPHRAQPTIVHDFIAERFGGRFLYLSDAGYHELLATIATKQILGGSTYDALIAYTATEHGATLQSLDRRATTTYEGVGATVDQLGQARSH